MPKKKYLIRIFSTNNEDAPPCETSVREFDSEVTEDEIEAEVVEDCNYDVAWILITEIEKRKSKK